MGDALRRLLAPPRCPGTQWSLEDENHIFKRLTDICGQLINFSNMFLEPLPLRACEPQETCSGVLSRANNVGKG